jgi:hypothetical protein
MSHLLHQRVSNRAPFPHILRWVFSCLFLAVAFGPQRVAFAGPETNREITQLRARWHFSRGELPQGILVLKEHLAEDADDGSALQLLGLVLMENGKFRDAASSFKRATTLGSPESRLVAFYNLADAYARAGAVTEAVATLKFAVQGGVPGAKVPRERRDQFLDVAGSVQAGASLPPYSSSLGSNWVLSAAVTGGYDSNVLLASEASVAAAEATEAASPVYSPSLQWSWRKPLGGDGKSLFVGAFASFTGYTQVDASVYNSLGVSQILDWQVMGRPAGGGAPSPWLFSVGNQLDLVLINTAGLRFFSAIDTVRPRLTRTHSSQSSTELELGLRWQSFVLPVDPSLDRTGPGVRPRLVHRTRVGPTLLAVGVGADLQFASGTEYRSWGVSLPLSVVVPRLWKSLGVVTSWEPTLTTFDQSASGRVDRLLQGSIGVRWSLGARSLVGVDLGLRSNQSTLEAATFSKLLANLSFTQDLF